MLATALPVAGPGPGPAATPPARLRMLGDAWIDEVRAVCPDPGAQDSHLCANGDPVEIAFLWPAGDMRLTCDPAPGAAAAARLDAAMRLTRGELSAARHGELRRLADGAAGGRYGAWVGSRLRAGRIRRKLYVEIAEGAPWRDWWPLAWLAGPAAATRLPDPVMAGFDGASDGVEVYCRTPHLHPVTLAALLVQLGLPAATGALTGELARITGRAVRSALPGRDQGISLAFGPDRRIRALTWYSHADMLFGPAARAREAWLRAGAGPGWPMADYAALSAPGPDGVPWHGLAGLTVGADGAVSASVTCAPRPWGTA